MNFTPFIEIALQLIILLSLFGVVLLYAIFIGRQAIINLIVGLYLTLPLYLSFPYHSQVSGYLNGNLERITAEAIIFLLMLLLSTKIISNLMPGKFLENKFETLGKKILLAASCTVLLMVIGIQVLKLAEVITFSTPILSVFSPETYYFWWLLLPLGILFFI